MKLLISAARRSHREPFSPLFRSAPALAAAALCLMLAGCGKPASNRTPVFKASGKISFEGQTPSGALVILHPKGTSSPTALHPTAQVQPDGTFQFTTYETGDGAPVGEYVVTVSWQQIVQQGGDYVPGPNLLPPRYSSPATSDVLVRVAEGPNDLQPIVLRR